MEHPVYEFHVKMLAAYARASKFWGSRFFPQSLPRGWRVEPQTFDGQSRVHYIGLRHLTVVAVRHA